MLFNELFDPGLAASQIDEIYRVPQSLYRGGAEDLTKGVTSARLREYFRNSKSLPGHSDLRYTILPLGSRVEIALIDPGVKTQIIGDLILTPKKTFPVPNSYEISVANIDERYRGRGLIFALYDLALDQLKGNLVSSTTQTPAGRKIWTQLIQDPSINVQGIAMIPSRSFTDRRLVDKTIEEIMKVGAVYLGQSTNRQYHVFAFPVESAGDELRNLIPDSKIKLYNSVSHIIKTGLMASRGAQVNEVEINDLDEGWREKTAALATAATLGYGALHNYQQAQQPRQPVQQTQQAPDPDQRLYKFVPQEHHVLLQTAERAGMTGAELEHFLAQIKAETGKFQHMVEQPPKNAKNPQRYFARKYEGRRILGNTQRGDGYRYRGRGYIQLTGRDNYTRAGRALGLDLVNNPDLAAEPETAARIAVWFWKNRVAPRVGDFERAEVRDVTHGINPGQAGAEKRQAYFQRVSQR